MWWISPWITRGWVGMLAKAAPTDGWACATPAQLQPSEGVEQERSGTKHDAHGTPSRPIARQGSRSGDAAREGEGEAQRPGAGPGADGIPNYDSDDHFELEEDGEDEEEKEGGEGRGGEKGSVGAGDLLDDMDYDEDYDLDEEEDDLPPFPGAEPPDAADAGKGPAAKGASDGAAPHPPASGSDAGRRQPASTASTSAGQASAPEPSSGSPSRLLMGPDAGGGRGEQQVTAGRALSRQSQVRAARSGI